MNRSNFKAINEHGDYHLMPYTLTVRTIAGIGFGLFTALYIVGISWLGKWMSNQSDLGRQILYIVCAGVLWLGVFLQIIKVFCSYTAISNQGLASSTIWDRVGLLSRPRLIPWRAIKKVRYSKAKRALFLHAPGYGTLCISMYQDGLMTLKDFLEKLVAPDVWMDAAMELNWWPRL
jgi:hypothetical protein